MNNTTNILTDLGKVPPQAIDCEEVVLGIILIDKNAIDDIISILTPEMFYKDAHQKIYSIAGELYKRGEIVDIITVSEELRDNNEMESIGGPVYLSKISSKIMTASSIEQYAYIIKEKYLLRNYIKIGSEITNIAFNQDVADVSEYAETELLRLAEQTHRKEPVRIGRLIDDLINKIEKIKNHEIKLIGLPSGFTSLDRITGGFKDQEYIVIAGRPSMGKTAMAIQIAINMAEQDIPVGFFSLEMSDESVGQRSLSGVSDKTNIELIQGNCEIEQLLKSSEELVKLPIYIDDTSGLSVLELRAKARKLKLQYGIRAIIVDYLQLMRGEGDSREQEVSFISRGLKSIAKDMEMPLIALSQLNRELEKRRDKRPILSDLRESGSIEQDADLVMFVYRGFVYGEKTTVIDNKEHFSEGIMELILAKNRNGAIGTYFLQHNKAMTKIIDEITQSS